MSRKTTESGGAVDYLFARSPVVETWADVRREMAMWVRMLVAFTLFIVAPAVVLGAVSTTVGLVWLLVAGVFGVVLGPLGYLAAPVMLPLGYRYVCLDISFGRYGWRK